MTSSPVTAWQIEGEKVEGVTDFLFLGRWWLQPWNQKTIASWQESDDKRRQCVEKQRHCCADKGPYSRGRRLPVVMWGCESWTIKKAGCQRVWNCGTGDDSWESLGQEGDQTSLKGNQPSILIGKVLHKNVLLYIHMQISRQWFVSHLGRNPELPHG